MFTATYFVIQKSINPQIKRFGARDFATEMCGKVVAWITVSFETFFLMT